MHFISYVITPLQVTKKLEFTGDPNHLTRQYDHSNAVDNDDSSIFDACVVQDTVDFNDTPSGVCETSSDAIAFDLESMTSPSTETPLTTSGAGTLSASAREDRDQLLSLYSGDDESDNFSEFIDYQPGEEITSPLFAAANSESDAPPPPPPPPGGEETLSPWSVAGQRSSLHWQHHPADSFIDSPRHDWTPAEINRYMWTAEQFRGSPTTTTSSRVDVNSVCSEFESLSSIADGDQSTSRLSIICV